MVASDPQVFYEAHPPLHLPEKTKEPPPLLTLTAEQQKVLDEVLAHFSKDDYVVPQTDDGALREEEKFWLSYECALRYLRATKWAGADLAIKRIEETLIWRREYGLYDLITASHVEPEAGSGKMFLFGYDVDNRPALFMRPGRQNTEESIRQLQFVVWYLERLAELMGPGVETIMIMVDFADRSKTSSVAQSRATVNILQNHYPERLGCMLVANVPFLIHTVLKMIRPFVDPVTRNKVRFNPAPVEEGLFVSSQLLREWGGDCVFEYDHERYWSSLIRMCAERRDRAWKAWRDRGAKVGLREWDIKCDVEKVENTAADPTPTATEAEPSPEDATEKSQVVTETVPTVEVEKMDVWGVQTAALEDKGEVTEEAIEESVVNGKQDPESSSD